MVPLLTSLPPRLERKLPGGAEIGVLYQRQCIQSWLQAGFFPISVNSNAELFSNTGLMDLAADLGVELVSTARSASNLTGRSHNVLLTDLLNVAVIKSHGEPFGIANADIFLRHASSLREAVQGLRPGQFGFTRRVDLTDPSRLAGIPYRHGFDFFALHPADAHKVPDIGLALGVPWWDHYLPALLSVHGGEAKALPSSCVYHLEHPATWENAVWATLGYHFLKQFRGLYPTPDNDFAAAIDKALLHHTDRSLFDLAFRLRRWLIPKYRRAEYIGILQRISNANLEYLNRL